MHQWRMGVTLCVSYSRLSMTNDDAHHDKGRILTLSVGERSDQSMQYAFARIQVRT